METEKGIDYGAANVPLNLQPVAAIQVNGPDKRTEGKRTAKTKLRECIVGLVVESAIISRARDVPIRWDQRSDEKFRLNTRRLRDSARTRRACARRSCCSL